MKKREKLTRSLWLLNGLLLLLVFLVGLFLLFKSFFFGIRQTDSFYLIGGVAASLGIYSLMLLRLFAYFQSK